MISTHKNITVGKDFCMHPVRNGYHELYIKSDGTTFCRACGYVEKKSEKL